MRTALILSIVLCVSLEAFGQSSVNSAGATSTNQSGSISYTVGQLDYITGANINQGVQQPKELFLTSVFSFAKAQNSLQLFPNPTSGILNMKLNKPESCQYAICDQNGKILHSTSSEGNIAQIDISHLPPGVYLLKVLRSNGQTTNYSVIHL